MRKVKIPLKQIAGGPQCAQPPSPHEPNIEMVEMIMRKYFWPLLWILAGLFILTEILDSSLGR